MTVKLIHSTPLEVCDAGIAKCWDSKCKTGDAMKERMHRVGVKHRHGSVLEHISYNFELEGISRACLQELARHRHASLSVKSSRYTLGELKNEEPFTTYTDIDHQEYTENGRERAEKYLVMSSDERVNRASILALDSLRDLLEAGISNDQAKYAMPEAYKTSLAWTINMRSLQNFLNLRTDKAALWEIRNLAHAVFDALPEDHKFMLEEYVKHYDKD